ncbi:hypothetical protein ACFL5K_03040 [Gemmatimonadota bacterium]
MDKVAAEFKDKGVDFYNVYTREPHPGEDFSKREGDERFDFTDKTSTKTYEERQANALKMIKSFGNNRPIMIDRVGKDCVQNGLGGNAPNSLALIDREGKLVLWQAWSNAEELRAKLKEMTGK